MRVVLWLSKALRVDDNPVLALAFKNSTEIVPVVCVDPREVNNQKISVNRADFFLRTLAELQGLLAARNLDLQVLVGHPEDVIPNLIKETGSTSLYCDLDMDQELLVRQHEALKRVADMKVSVHVSECSCLTDHRALLAKHAANWNPMTFEGFVEAIELADILPPSIPPTRISGRVELGKKRDFPTLSSLGFSEQPSYTWILPGHKAAETALDRLCSQSSLESFNKGSSTPVIFSDCASTSMLSPYISHGVLSVRRVFAEVASTLNINGEKRWAKERSNSSSFLSQLLWREFFYFIGRRTANFGKIQGNAICRKIPWRLSSPISGETDKAAETQLSAWESGTTGFPWIDAFMRQMKTEGWVHHIGRHACSSFLTRGQLYISWEKGFQIFQKHFLDYDYYLNAGNWLWISSSAFSSAFFRVYSPTRMPKLYSGAADFVLHFLPMLNKIDLRNLFEPWKDARFEECGYNSPVVEEDIALQNISNLRRIWPELSVQQRGSESVLPGGVQLNSDGTLVLRSGQNLDGFDDPAFEQWKTMLSDARNMLSVAESSIAKVMEEGTLPASGACAQKASSNETITFTASDVLYCKAVDRFEQAYDAIRKSKKFDQYQKMASFWRFQVNWGECIMGRAGWLIASASTLDALSDQGAGSDEIEEMASGCLGCFSPDGEKELKKKLLLHAREKLQWVIDQASSDDGLSEAIYNEASEYLADIYLQLSKLTSDDGDIANTVGFLIKARKVFFSLLEATGSSAKYRGSSREGDVYFGSSTVSALLLTYAVALGGSVNGIETSTLESDSKKHLFCAIHLGSVCADDLINEEDFASVRELDWFKSAIRHLS
eukprot:CAMPEP_0113918328 /NCGR_PEP_ID=MMETSP0780_2-20120614/33287_1 /TAXON_ID=652834 /ORGANISM="Palpitomonas bilix" /LENGTH=834 /DNA_ID=CAMNT_0000918117 /DNA_START=132 /DNA_END=2636 /DNA_ORIENTATION=+ /assembly_acc=CAM_ASM_000599